MPELNVHFSPDEMIAYLDIPAGFGNRPSLNILQTMLKRLRVVEGIDIEQLNGIVRGEISGKDIVIANGKPARQPVDGRLEWLVENIAADSTSEFPHVHKRKKTLMVRAGDRIVTIHQAASGIPGVTVTGNVVAVKEPTDVEVVAGTGTVREGSHIVAAIDGSIKFDGVAVEILKFKNVDGDIDPKNGPVDFEGTLSVSGSVHSGVHLSVSGDIIVSGNVGDAVITCGGTVVVDGDIDGNKNGKIVSRESVVATRMSRFLVVAGGDVTVTDVIRDSSIIADGNVTVLGVVGGSITANSITAGSAGSAGEDKTVLDSSRKMQLSKERYDLLKRFGAMTTERADTVNRMYMMVRDGLDQDGILDDGRAGELDKLKQMVLEQNKTSLSIRSRLAGIESSERLHTEKPRIRVEKAFPGTVFKSERNERKITSEECNVEFV